MKLRVSQPLLDHFVTDVIVDCHHRFPIGATLVMPSVGARFLVLGVFYGAGVTYRLAALDDKESKRYSSFTMNALDAERSLRLEDQP